MIDLELIKTYLGSKNLTVNWEDGRTPSIDDYSTEVEYFIGYNSIRSIPNPFIPQSDLELLDSDEVQVFETKIICLPEFLYSSWNSLRDAFLNYNPNPLIADYSVINHVEGAVIGKGAKIVHLDRWNFYISP